MAKKIKPLDLFIVKHTDVLVRVIAVVMFLWFIGGLFAVDYLNPIVFLCLWIPFGLIAAWFAKKW